MGIKRDEEEVSRQDGTPESPDVHKRLKSADDLPSGPKKQLASSKEIRGKGGLRFETTSDLPKSDFCSFIEKNSKEDVVGFFREIIGEMEEKRGVMDFHLKVREQKQWFCVEVFFGDDDREGPAEAPESGECISCCAGAALYPGQEPVITAGECVLAEFSDQPHMQCSLDAKARSGFVVTPVRHVEKMSELQDEELFALWSTAVRVLRQDSLPFRTMILNHGTYRNTPHLLLKVWVDDILHRQVRLKWDSKKVDVWSRLLAMVEMVPKKPCKFFQERGYCGFGERCRLVQEALRCLCIILESNGFDRNIQDMDYLKARSSDALQYFLPHEARSMYLGNRRPGAWNRIVVTCVGNLLVKTEANVQLWVQLSKGNFVNLL